MGDSAKLRLLDPVDDVDLYREAFDWRQPKRHISSPQMPFETFIDSEANQLTFGLFDDSLLAVYFYREWDAGLFEAHFTSRKGVARETLIWGGQVTVDTLLTYGAMEVGALILPANKPLQRFVRDVGLERIGLIEFTSCGDLSNCTTITPTRNHRWVKYAKMRANTPVGPIRPKTNVYLYDKWEDRDSGQSGHHCCSG